MTGRRSVLAALAANVAVAATKLVGFLLTGSTGLLAETFHSIADSGNQALLLLGAHRAAEQPSPAHPFGRGRERYFWAFIVGLVLFGLGGGYSIYEGADRLMSGTHEVTNTPIALVLLAAALVIEGLSLRTGVREASGIRPVGQSWWAFIRRTRNPEVTVVLLEDGAAVIGLSFAAIGVVLTGLTGDAHYDAYASIAIGVLLCVVAAVLTTEMRSLLIGETIPHDLALRLQSEIAAVDGVSRVLNLRTEHLGPDQVLVCVKIAITSPADLSQVVSVINAVELRVSDVLPDTLTCYVEPDVFDPDRVDAPWT